MAAATTSPLVKTYTLEEFWALSEPEDGWKLELIEGVLYMTPPPDEDHNWSVSKLMPALVRHLDRIGVDGQLYVPRAGISTGERTWLEPDLFIVLAETRAKMGPGRPTTADIVFEVYSPSTKSYDSRTKSDTYAYLGVRELWLLDEDEKTVEVRNQDPSGDGRRFGPGRIYGVGELIVSEVFPLLQLRPEQIFR